MVSETDEPGNTVDLDECLIRTFTIGGKEKRVIVYYTTTSSSTTSNTPVVDADGDGVNDWADNVARWTDEAWRAFVSYGMDSPARIFPGGGVEELEVGLLDIRNYAGWCCTDRWYVIDTPSMVDDDGDGDLSDEQVGVETAVIHEVFHSSEWSSGSWGWVNDGTATTMQDKTDATIDLLPGAYLGWADIELGNLRAGLFWASYDSALWWTYVMERFGTSSSEPGIGTDFLADFFDEVAVGREIETLDSLIRDRTAGAESMDTAWRDFCVANYVKNLPDPDLPAKYRYVDEMTPPRPADFDNDPSTPSVMRDIDLALAPGSPGAFAVVNTQPWSARYYRLLPDPTLPIISVEIRQDSRRAVDYTMLVIKGGVLVDEIQGSGPDFVRSIPNDGYDEVVVVVSSFASSINFRYNFHATEPQLRILFPRRGAPANVGDPSSPGKFRLNVEILSPTGGGTPVEGVAPGDFEITVGGEPAALVPPGTYAAGQYWLLVDAPVQTPPLEVDLLYDLTVTWATLSDTQPNVIDYSARQESDNMIVFDRSGSMADFGKMESAQVGARLFVDSWQTGDKLGLISFAASATDPPEHRLQDWNSASRMQALAEINGLVAAGATGIGDALYDATNELDDRGRSGDRHPWALVVLSDGRENRAPYLFDYYGSWVQRSWGDDPQKQPIIHCIGIGPDANSGDLQALSMNTGGTYLYAAEPPPVGSGGGASGGVAGLTGPLPGEDLPNDLAEYYRIIAEGIGDTQQIYAERGTVVEIDEDVHTIRVDSGADEVTFSVNWYGPEKGYGDTPGAIRVLRPSGVEIPSSHSDTTHRVYRVNAPEAGNWEVRIRACGEFCATKYLVEAALRSQLRLRLHVVPRLEDRVEAAAVPILATLTDAGPVLDATIDVRVVIPERRWALNIEPETTREIRLYDDGRHGDGERFDGLYGNAFHGGIRPGSYDVTAVARGTSSIHGAYVRRARSAFFLEAGQDSDGDGMVDSWEIAHGLNPDWNDRDEDPDMDVLTNYEEYENGTHPQDSDTDGGGENDASEIETGSDANDPTDDAMRPIFHFGTEAMDPHFVSPPDPGNEPLPVNRLRLSLGKEHQFLVLWRSQKPDGVYEIVASQFPATGQYFDFEVQPDTPYYYKLMAFDGQGNASAIAGPLVAVAKTDHVPPAGAVRVLDGANEDPALVDLILEASHDTAEMRIANNSAFLGADWQPYANKVTWQLPTPKSDGNGGSSNGPVHVFVQFRDAAQNVSKIAFDAVTSAPDDDFVDLESAPGCGGCASAGGGAATDLLWVLLGLGYLLWRPREKETCCRVRGAEGSQ